MIVTPELLEWESFDGLEEVIPRHTSASLCDSPPVQCKGARGGIAPVVFVDAVRGALKGAGGRYRDGSDLLVAGLGCEVCECFLHGLLIVNRPD